VVRPIPTRIIGITVLRTFYTDKEINSRNFWGLREYPVHLFGSEIKISSLAFQEQDSVVAACATTAIWSMLNKAAVDYHTILKSPSQITKDAANISSDGSRLFPNKGLNLLQICQAIFNSGLVSEIKKDNYPVISPDGLTTIGYFVSNQYLKKILRAYSPIGIPLILILRVRNNNNYGLHAITVSGYHQKEPISCAPISNTRWLSDDMEKIYAHDDQWGPFVRITFTGDVGLETPWSEVDPLHEPTIVTSIVIPIYPKIRISYEDIEVIVLGLDRILSFFFDKKLMYDLVWDIRIDYSENFKVQTKKFNLTDIEKSQILTSSLPKYVWISSCHIGDYKVFDFTFDGTDVTPSL
jgi:hypothetical protein